MHMIDHPTGGYRFLPGIAPYSRGVVAADGFEIVHVVLRRLVPWREGFDLAARHLTAQSRPLSALCAMELRSPVPFTFAGFASFNREYAQVLDQSWGVFVEGVNPVARTNVAPAHFPPDEPSLFAFSFTRPVQAEQPSSRPSFVVAGAGELPEGVLTPEAIVSRGLVTTQALEDKTRFVMDLMEERLIGLGAAWTDVTAVDVYTVHPFDRLVPSVLAPRLGPALARGLTWHVTRPPIQEIEFEMDLRGIRHEWVLEV